MSVTATPTGPDAFMTSPTGRSRSRIALAWVAMVGVDLLFHAGLFAAVFDQAREPGLLADEVLFRRIPFAYAALMAGALALWWILDWTGSTGPRALVIGATSGLTLGVMGLGALWTAIDITGLLVAAGIAALVAQGVAAAKVLTSSLETRPLSLRVIGFLVGCFVAGQITANLVG